MSLPLLVATPSPGMAYNHAEFVSGVDRARDHLVQPPLERMSDIQRELDEQRRLAKRLLSEKERLQAENEILIQENDELRSRHPPPAVTSQTKEVKRLKKELNAAKQSLASTAKLLQNSQRTVADLRADAAADAVEKPVASRKAAPKRRQPKAKPSVAQRPGPRARSEPPRYEEDESGSESDYSGADDDDRRDDRSYSSRGLGYSDDDDSGSYESDFDRPTSRRTRQRQRRRQDPQSAAFAETLNVARQSLNLREYEKVQQYTDHRRRVATVRPGVDCSAPKRMHMLPNVKREQQQRERKEQQRKDTIAMQRRVNETARQAPMSHW